MDGRRVAARRRRAPAYDPGCYLCPGNARVGGARNPRYDGTFVFDNDHPCVGPDAPRELAAAAAALPRAPAAGLARVVCFSPRHDLTLAEMPPAAIGASSTCGGADARARRPPGGRAGACFENKGDVVGVSNPHPHGQIYATGFVWKTIETELARVGRATGARRAAA